MLLTLEEQKETLHAAAQSVGIDVTRDEIEWRDEFFESGGLKLHYMDWGTRGWRPLLLLHGGMQTAHSWDITAVAMRRDHHVVAMDLRGHGDSDWSEEAKYSHHEHAGDIGAILKHLGWERVTLVGLSLGGLASMQFASEHSAAVEAFVIVDVGPELSPRGVGRLVDFGRNTNELASLEEFIEKSLKYNPRRSAQQLRYSLTHNLRQLPDGTYAWKYDRRIVRRPEGDQPAGAEADPNHFQDMWGVLPKITCPTLLVRGAASDVFPEETARRMIELLPNAQLVTVADASHTVPQDNPSGFLEVLRPFLTST